jgi:chemotaxis signal transduction protein
MTDLDRFLPFMHDVQSCDTSLRELNLMWRLIESSIKMNHADAAAAILPTMASTRHHFKGLEEDLLTSLVREKVASVMREIGTKAQYVIDIVVRNLYERTADVGFLATDPELCAYVSGLFADSDRMAERLRAYRSKYTVYDAILLLDTHGSVLAQAGEGERITRSTDPVLAQALASEDYLQVFRPSDLRPGKSRALVYARRMLHPLTGVPAGVLCLCFHFEEEMSGIFRSHREAAAGYNMLLLDAENRCIASADPDWIPVGAQVQVNPEGSPGIFMHAGRQYLVSTFAAQGYQGYRGPPGWQGQVMAPLDVAFQRRASEQHARLDPVLRRGLLTHAKRFSPPLEQILTAADTVRRVVWNGQVMTAGRRGATARLQPVLEQISETGQRSNEVFASSIRDLYATVLSASLRNAEFVSHLLVDLMDRNLYERADDCRWWALNPLLRRTLQEPARGASELSAMAAVLQYINKLYTVYTRIVVYDVDGHILAQSLRDGAAVASQTRIEPDVLARVTALQDDQCYFVTPFAPSALYEGRCTYVYHAAIRAADQASRVVGGIGLVFDASRELPAMLHDGLAGKPNTSAFFVDRAGRVLASTDPSRPVGSQLAPGAGMLAVPKGGNASSLVVHDGEYAVLGCSGSNGYREFKVSDGYSEDVVAVVCERFGPVVDEVRAWRATVAPAGAARGEGAVEVATFFCGGGLFALDIDNVREARPASELARARIGCPPGSVGLLRVPHADGGEKTIWVFDLGALVRGRASTVAVDSQVIVVVHGDDVIGLLGDELHAVSSYPESQVCESPIAAQNRLVRSIIQAHGGALIQLLDIDRLFRLFRDPDGGEDAGLRPRLLDQAEFPRNDDLGEDHRVGPAACLPPEVASARVDPGVLGHIAGAHQELEVGDRDLCVLHAADDQHRRHRLLEQTHRFQ